MCKLGRPPRHGNDPLEAGDYASEPRRAISGVSLSHETHGRSKTPRETLRETPRVSISAGSLTYQAPLGGGLTRTSVRGVCVCFLGHGRWRSENATRLSDYRYTRWGGQVCKMIQAFWQACLDSVAQWYLMNLMVHGPVYILFPRRRRLASHQESSSRPRWQIRSIWKPHKRPCTNGFFVS